MRRHWNRWIYSSVAKHFAEVAEANNIYFYIAGRRDEIHSEFIELKVTGPDVTEECNNYFKIGITLDIIYSVLLTPEDGYKAQKIAGIIEEAITDICIYKYGDDDSFFGTLQVKRQPIESNCFGQVRPDTRIIQGVVSAALQMTTKE